MVSRALFVATMTLVAAVLLFEFSWMGAAIDAPPPMGKGEDWDWQLTQIEVARLYLDNGLLPGWNPFTQGGQPLLANPELPILSPTMLVALTHGSVVGVKVGIAVNLVLVAVGFGVAGRELGLSWFSANLGAAFLAGSVAVAEFIGVGHIMFTALGWLPLAWAAQRRSRPGLAALALAACLYSGGHYLFVFGVVWLVVDALARSAPPERARGWALVLAANGLLIGAQGRGQGLFIALSIGAAVHMWFPALLARLEGWSRPRNTAIPVLLVTLTLAALLTAPRWLLMFPLLDEVSRLSHDFGGRVADDGTYTWPMALEVLSGQVPRYGGHEGQNVFASPVWVVGLLGLVVAAWQRPGWGVVGLFFWCVGWSGTGPLPIWGALSELPVLGQVRVVERFSLIWTPLLGYGAGFLIDAAWARARPAAVCLAVAVLVGLAPAVPAAAFHQQLGGWGPPHATARDFLTTEGRDEPNFVGVLNNRAALDATSALALDHPGPVAVGPDAWLDGEPIEVDWGGAFWVDAPHAGRLVLNQNGVEGWPSAVDGLAAADVPAGVSAVRYRPPLLGLSLALSALGLLLLAATPGARRAWLADADHREDPPG